MKTSILIVAAFLALCLVPVAQGQVTQSGALNSNTLNSTANIVTLDTAAVALQETVTTPGPGALVCSTYPVITFIVTRNAVNSTLAVVTIASGVYWQASPLFTPLLAGDLIFAKLTTAGVGCTNELPFTVSTIYSPQAGLCDANPSACVNLTGTIAGTNGMTAKNLTLTFRPSQMAFLGGVPPTNTPSSGGSTSGLCEILGVNPGDICYFTGSAWAVLTGNTAVTHWLQENASGVPSWATPVSSIQMKNAGTNFGSPMTGDGSLNCVGCTWSGAAPNFTLTVPVMIGDSGSGGVAGLAPAPAAGDAAALKYLKADGTWQIPAGTFSGLTNVIMPTAEFASSITGTVETVTKQVQNQGTAWMGPTVGTTPTPTIIQDVFCSFTSGTSGACSFLAGTGAGNLYYIEALESRDNVSTFTVGDGVGVDTFTPISNGWYNSNNGIVNAYAKNVVGGAPVVTVGTGGVPITGNLLVHMVEIAGLDKTSPLDVASVSVLNFEGPTTFATLTTSNPSDLVIATMGIGSYGGAGISCSAINSPGFVLAGQQSASMAFLTTQYANFTTAGVHTPAAMATTCSGSWTNWEQAVAFKAATTFNTNQPFFRHQIFSDWWWALPGLYGVTPSNTPGDTQVDLHVGTSIALKNQTSDPAAVLLTPAVDSSFILRASLNCHTQAAVSAIPSFTYTDQSNTSETVSGSSADCTTLGTNSTSYISIPINAKGAGAITFHVAPTGAAHFDVSAVVLQWSNQ
jgi:hypothetical protein